MSLQRRIVVITLMVVATLVSTAHAQLAITPAESRASAPAENRASAPAAAPTAPCNGGWPPQTGTAARPVPWINASAEDVITGNYPPEAVNWALFYQMMVNNP